MPWGAEPRLRLADRRSDPVDPVIFGVLFLIAGAISLIVFAASFFVGFVY